MSKNQITRRQALAGVLGVTSLSVLNRTCLFAVPPEKPLRMGVVIHSYGIRSGAPVAAGEAKFSDPIQFLEYCHSLGAGGVQVGIGIKDKEYLARLRSTVEKLGVYLEAIISLPREKADVTRFDDEVRTAREAGVRVFRSAILGGRRYETFDTAESFRQFKQRAYESVGLAEPIAAKHDMRLAIENHKDWRIDELLDILRRASSKHVGVCIDTGNSIALLEDPHEVVDAYAPWAFTTHFKDMGVQEYADGFLLSEVPLGTGFLDMKRIVETLRNANPNIRFNLEMMTRDPLKIPCLTPKYWATFESLPGINLANALARVRQHAAQQPLPVIASLPQAQKVSLEDDNVRRCFAYARERLNL